MAVKKLKPVRHKNARSYIGGASRRVRSFERRYEMSTEKLRTLVAAGEFPETAEVSEWLHAANEIAFLKERLADGRSTAGSASTGTSRSTKARSNGTRSS